nr:hypothetical protein [Tanacetum cinerariifolium]
MQTTHEMEDPSHSEFKIGADDQPIAEPSQHPEWFSQQRNLQLQIVIRTRLYQLPTEAFNRADDQPIVQSSQHPEWFSQPQKPPTLDLDTLTPKLLAGPTNELMKGSCKSLIELEYHLEEVYKAIMDQLDWVNPEGQQYPHNLLQPLPLIPDNRGRRVIPFAHFLNNELEYLRGGASSRKYTTSVTKTKAADYGHIKWIKDLFYSFAVNRESARDVYSKRKIVAVTELKIMEWHSYKHLDWITVRRDDDKLYKFKEGDLKRLCLQDIEDMLLLLVQGKLSNLTVVERFVFNVSLRMFTRSIVIQRRVEDLQLGGISHWGRKCQQFYGFAVNKESARDVYSKRRIIAINELKIVEWHNYKHLDWITSQELKNVSYHKLYDILKQHQHEVNEIRAKKIACVANLLALVAQQQPVYHPQTHPTNYNQNSSTRSQQAATGNRGKAIVNSPRPTYDQEPSMVDDDDDETLKDKEIDKLMALISLSFKKIFKPTNNNLHTSSNTSRAN